MALLLITDGTPRTVKLAHTPPFTLEEIRILTGCENIQVHRITHPQYTWMVMDENARAGTHLLKEPEGLNIQATDLWAHENGYSREYMISSGQAILGTVLLLTADEFTMNF